MANKDELVEQFLQAALLHGPVLVNKAQGEFQDAPSTCMGFLAQNQGQHSSNFWQKIQACRFEDPKNMQLRLLGTTLDEDFTERICSFISSKSDLLFTGKGKEELRKGIDYETETVYQDLYGALPPLEIFMGIPALVKRCQLLKIMKEGDVVIGKVTAKKPFGLFVKLVDLEFSKSRDFTDTNIQALCKSNDLNKDTNHREYTDPTDAFRIGDYIRGVIVDVSVDDQRIALSLKSSKLPAEHQHLFLGLLEDFDKRKLRYNCYEQDKSYTDHLDSHPGLNNPKSIDTLTDMLGIDTNKQCSFLRGLVSKDYPAGDYYDELRRRQSVKWSMGSTAKGIEHFKAGEMNMALKYLDHALQIDEQNIEALVAKGALLANEGKYNIAVPLFRQALSINNKHRNAMKYLVETLLEQGIQQQKTSCFSKAEQCFQEVLHLQPDNSTANDHLVKTKKMLAIKHQKEKEIASKQEGGVSKFSHVRRLIEEEEYRRKKKKKKEKKKKKKHEKKKGSRSRHRHTYSSSESSSESDETESHRHAHKYTLSDRKRSTEEKELRTREVYDSTARKHSISSSSQASSSTMNLSPERSDYKRSRKY